jgi:V8-like Glu-specific endopeptidase
VIGQGIDAEKCRAKDMYATEQTELQVLLNGTQSGAITPDVNLADMLQNGKKVKVCFEKGLALVTTMIIYGGASGSPMVDSLGRVIGVVYAAPATGGWGYGVTLTDINTILKGR